MKAITLVVMLAALSFLMLIAMFSILFADSVTVLNI